MWWRGCIRNEYGYMAPRVNDYSETSGGFTMPVLKGEDWDVECDGTFDANDYTITWMPLTTT
jgi:hypothetical protein